MCFTKLTGKIDNSYTDEDEDSGLLVFHDVKLGNQSSSSEQKKLHIKAEIDQYLRAKPTENIANGLKDYPFIRSVFLKYNCIRSSEAICERMFSFAGRFFPRLFCF